MPGGGETTVGSIVGVFRMDADQFHREAERVLAEAEAIKSADTTVRVRVDEQSSSAGLSRVKSGLDDATAASRRLEDATARVGVAQQRLNELQNGNASQSRILQAQLALNKARRDEQDVIFGSYRANLDLADSHERVAVAARKSADSTDELGRKAKESQGNFNALATAIVGLGPALIPLGAAAVGLGAAFGGMGAAAVAALVGIKQEMDAGTDTGRAYSAGLATLKTDLTSLGSVAAGGVLAPFQAVVREITQAMPQLNSQIGEFANITGRTAGSLVSGLLQAFIQLEPLMREAGAYVENLAARFQALVSGGGVTSFADYVRSVFPQVVQEVEQIVTAVVRLVAAFAPLGSGILGILGQLATVINAIPVDVLSVLATGAVSVYLGFQAWSGLRPIIAGIGAALESVTGSAVAAEGAIRGLTLAAGAIGIAVTALTFLFTYQAEQTRKNEQAINDYADALRASNGVIDDNVRATAAKNLADQGVLDTAQKLGFNLRVVTDAATGNAGALQMVKDQSDSLRRGLQFTTEAQDKSVASLLGQKDALGGLSASYGEAKVASLESTREMSAQDDALARLDAALGISNGQIDAAKTKNQQLADATRGVTGDTEGHTAILGIQAGQLGTTVTALQAYRDAQDKQAAATANATLKMQEENDAAGLLKQALDNLAGKTLSAQEAQNSFDQAQAAVRRTQQAAASSQKSAADQLAAATDRVAVAQANLNKLGSSATDAQKLSATKQLADAHRALADAQAAATKATQDNSRALDGQSDAAIQNRAQFLNLAEQAKRTAEAFATQTGSSEQGKQKLADLTQAITDNAVANGFARDKVQAFIDKVLQVPESVPPTVLDIDTKNAEAKIANLRGLIQSLNNVQVAPTGDFSGLYRGKSVPQAYGGIQHFDMGGMRLPSSATIAPDGANLIQWAEKGTGDEAFIPLASSRRATSLPVLEEANRRMGSPLGGGAGAGTTTITHRTEAPVYIENLTTPDVFSFQDQMARDRLSRLGPRG